MTELEETGLDYETYSDVPLGGDDGEGVPRYVASPNFRALCVSVSDKEGEHTYDWVFGVRRWSTIDGDYADEVDVTASFEAWLRLNDRAPIMAHNAPFERAVTGVILPDFDPFRFQDSAVDASILGAERALEVASRQLTNTGKLATGKELIQLFCVPNEQYPNGPTSELIVANGHMEQWMEFIHYCEVDAKAGKEIRQTARRILAEFDDGLIDREAYNEQGTWLMNVNGWHTDKKLLQKMKLRSWANSVIAQRAFRADNDEEINFNSHVQLKKFCELRGVPVRSLDKYQLPVVLANVKKRIEKLDDKDNTPQIARAIAALKEVESLLETKLEIGGTTLSKLPVILRTMSDDDILRDQYVHFGAGATGRTSARGAQLQNLKQLRKVRDVETLYDLQVHWSNGDMADQFRQVFTSRHPDGEILVGDFAGVESRGLAYEAGEEWKLKVFREGTQDLYRVLVTKFIPGLDYELVTDDLRPRGKYSELSCGYQASGKAVQDFMFRLNFPVTIEEATQNVNDWRRACPNIVDWWGLLDDALKTAVRSGQVVEFKSGGDLTVRISPFSLPSIQEQHPGALSLCLQLLNNGMPYVTRFIHGCYFRKEKLCYYKPRKRMRADGGGNLWLGINETMSAKKSKELGRPVTVHYSVYGGKLAAIFTQSLCREIFFDSLKRLRELFEEHDVQNAFICGQFHDEINVDWVPGKHSKEFVMDLMRDAMTHTELRGFPLAVEIKSAYRYIK